MNIFLWIIQILLALHTLAGAVWKFSNSEPSLKAIPHGVWLAMSVIEILCSVSLVLPAFAKSLDILAPIAAICIAGEMLLDCGVNIFSGNINPGHLFYWLVVAFICALVAYGGFQRWKAA